MNAELLLPAEAGVLREALAAWTERDRIATTAAERLRRIHAQLNAAAGKPLYATAREPRDTKASRLSWLAAACAAALVAAACAGWLYHTLGKPPAPLVQPGEGKKEKGEKAVAQDHQPAPALEVGTVQECMDGFYRRVDAAPPRWETVAKGATLHSGELLQVASDGDTAEVQVFGAHRVRLEPGTIVRVGLDPKDPQVGICAGHLNAWAKAGRLRIASLHADTWTPSDLCTVQDGEQVVVAADRQPPESARVQQEDGFLLWDPAALPRMNFTVQQVRPETPVKAPAPEKVNVQQGTANLLNVIDVDLENVPVKDAVETFVALLNVRIKLSPAAEKAAGAKKVTLKIEKLTGAEALSKFCTLAGLSFNVAKGEIVLRLPNEPKTAPAPENSDF